MLPNEVAAEAPARASASSIRLASSRLRRIGSMTRQESTALAPPFPLFRLNTGRPRQFFFSSFLYTRRSLLRGRCVTASTLKSSVNRTSADFQKNSRRVIDLLTELKNQDEVIRQGGGAKAIEAQHKKGRLTARERIAKLIDPDSYFFELGAFAAFEMYEEWGGAPSAGVVTGLARVCNRHFMLICNDATVKAGAFFPMTAKKVIRAQNIAIENRIPTIYLVDSAGVFLPLQEDVFPDTDDFGRVFRNNAVMSAMGIPQMTAIMGM